MTFSNAEAGLADEWADKWINFAALVNNVTGTDDPPVMPPDYMDEINYQGFRFWFLDHQDRFLPLWKEFCESQSWYTEGEEDDDDEEMEEKYLENPFRFVYEPENIYEMVKQLEIQSGTDIWEPSEYITSKVRSYLVLLCKRITEFAEWIEERA